MNAPAAKLLVFAGNEFIAIRIIGRANLNSTVDFRTLVNELAQKGYRYFILDLSECILMDSSFLGVLAGFGLKMSGDSVEKCRGTIELSNPNPRILELIEVHQRIGIDQHARTLDHRAKRSVAVVRRDERARERG